ncbi:NfeD family protein [Frateuria hangzhouensis]|uniref:NfeD family protein n=1 Tax=Frateuria hangzhouensis TaxID=2995589 RepID=UPI002260C04F|nr:nodulation protein NfeD [Frateuria sp. STR12]MCX7515153.1 nodulation protein NfeD [Frateuria sp. STR12]
MARRTWSWWTAAALLVSGLGALASRSPAGDPGSGTFVARIELSGPIGPAAAEYVDDAMRRATDDGAAAIVLQMDTPGGLAESMRPIIADILASDVPVLGYVAPGGARAASAGTYILYACHVAAMAPATHLGAATPVSLGGDTPMPAPGSDRPSASKGTGPAKGSSAPQGSSSSKDDDKTPAGNAESNKALNDAIAYIRSLAQLRGRNAAWAEQAVRGAATLTASEAMQEHVIDIVASDATALLAQVDGRTVRIGERRLVLHLTGLPLRDYAPGWRNRFLATITNPTIAYMLLLAGIYGLILEAFHPGALLPGITGGICLLIGLYALQLLPVNYAGLALMALGIGLLVAEAFSPSVGALGIGGLIAFVVGSIMLFRTGVPGYGVNLGVIAGLAFCAMVGLGVLLRLAMRARRAPHFSVEQSMQATVGELLQPVGEGGEGWARIQGERWRVRCTVALPAGARVRVLRRDGLLLWVEPT